MSESYHYQVIRRVIGLMETEGLSGLDELSARIGMSSAHLQRVFSAWVGVSPKRYAQFLMLPPARQMLKAQASLEHVSLSLGLSGTARLHDLFLRWEAMSPGEYARGGAGVTLAFGRFDSPFGPVIAMGTERGLSGMVFVGADGEEATRADLRARWPRARVIEAPERLQSWVDAAFARHGEARLHIIGRPFQIKVWEALLNVPEGGLVTYGDIAERIGQPKAARAVGQALGQNPLAVLIPCHRVIRGDGGIGGYRWGPDTKRRILACEAARAGEGDAGIAQI